MLHRKKSTNLITQLMVDVGSKKIPMIIYRERRRSWRVAVGQQAVNLRIPSTWHYGMPENPVEWGVSWTRQKYKKDPQLFDHFFLSPPANGHIYRTLYGDFTLKLNGVENRKTAGGKVVGDQIIIKFPISWDARSMATVFPKLISRILASEFHDHFSRRVADLNNQFYQFLYSDITFKYNKSNWGSCSYKGHLNFSTRLFLAPQIVADYVIIHELAHLKEHNHSSSFWEVVSAAMPRYKDQVKWLKTHGSTLYF
jgi:predicted metal-dependent hydrolase